MFKKYVADSLPFILKALTPDTPYIVRAADGENVSEPVRFRTLGNNRCAHKHTRFYE